MARYVVLHFEDNEEAEEFCKTNTIMHATLHKATGKQLNQRRTDCEIRALVPAPTQFCECGITGRKTTGGWFKGKKYGWWVCAVCGKPTEAWGSSYAAVVGAGVNLLVEEQVQPPAGYDQER